MAMGLGFRVGFMVGLRSRLRAPGCPLGFRV